MPYSFITELPQAVRGALDPEDQTCWMKKFNSVVMKEQDAKKAWKEAWRYVMDRPSVRFVTGILSRGTVDDQRERLNQRSVAAEFDDLIWNYGATINDHHTNRACGVWFDRVLQRGKDGVEQVRALGVAYKGKSYYDEFWDNVRKGKTRKLSIGIYKLDKKYECDEKQCWRQVDKLQVFEGSVVGRSSCPGTVIDGGNFSTKGYNEELAMGLEVELEHGTIHPDTNITDDDPEMTKKIAEAHLKEIPDYYTRLKAMEKEAMETNEGAATEQSPEANPAPQMSDKEAIGLGDVGVETLNKLLAVGAENGKRLAALDEKLSSYIREKESEKAVEPYSEGGDGEPPKEGVGADKKKEKDAGDKEDKVANKGDGIVPPYAPTSPASENEIGPIGTDEAANPARQPGEDKEKQANLAAVRDLEEKREMSEKEGATTPRPETAAQDQGVKTKDAVQELLANPDGLRQMSAHDIERFVNKYSKGEI